MYPPRPKHRIRPSELQKYENQRIWVVQRKFNGTRTVVHIDANGKVGTWTRYNTPHKQWQLSRDVSKQILGLNVEPGREYLFDAELLHSKTTDRKYKNRLVLFDLIQSGRYLFGSPTLIDRYHMLQSICGNPKELEPASGIALVVSENVWLAETYDKDFTARFQDFIDLDEIEGLVLKKKNSVIDNFGKKEYEVTWQLRCRKEHKNYIF
jgi:ATP-dependent DNA ligase